MVPLRLWHPPVRFWLPTSRGGKKLPSAKSPKQNRKARQPAVGWGGKGVPDSGAVTHSVVFEGVGQRAPFLPACVRANAKTGQSQGGGDQNIAFIPIQTRLLIAEPRDETSHPVTERGHCRAAQASVKGQRLLPEPTVRAGTPPLRERSPERPRWREGHERDGGGLTLDGCGPHKVPWLGRSAG